MAESRVTKAGGILVANDGGARVTKAGAVLIGFVPARPEQPSVDTLDPICSDAVTVHTSAFVHFQPGRTHRATRYQARRLDTGVTFYDSGYLTDDLLSHQIPLPVPGIGYEVRALHQDDLFQDSEWSEWVAFTALAEGEVFCLGPPPAVDPETFFLGWNVTPNDIDLPGGWLIPTCCEDEYRGQIIQYRRFFTYPAAMLSKDVGPRPGYRVSGNIQHFNSRSVGFPPWRYWENELVSSGLCALASGRIELINPTCIYQPACQSPQPYTGTPIAGVFAFIRTGFIQPFGDCDLIGTGASNGPDARFTVQVWYDGRIQGEWSVTIPASDIEIVHRACLRYPWYHMVLDVQRDLIGDPTGRTHVIKAGWAKGFNTLVPQDAGWNIEETWVGGLEESQPGAGDGGLPCGFAGYAGQRTSGNGVLESGWTLFRGLTVSGYGEEVDCLPGEDEIPEDEIPEPVEIPPVASKPCPPEEPTAALDLFLGQQGGGGVFQYGGSELDDDGVVVARIQPNPWVPAGFGGEALVTNVYLTFAHRGDVNITVIPIANDERLFGESKTIFEIGTGEDSGPVTKELALSRPYERGGERLRYGVRCQSFTVLILLQDICGSGLSVDGIEIEWEPVRERHPKTVFTEQLLGEPFYVPATNFFLGQKGGGAVLGAADVPTDDGSAIASRAESQWIAPAGWGGECLFTNAYPLITRWNSEPVKITVTPQVDGEELDPVVVTLPPTDRPLTEVLEIPVTRAYQRVL